MKSGSPKLLEPSGLLQACNGIALPLPSSTVQFCLVRSIVLICQQCGVFLSVVPYHHLSSTVLFHLQYLTATWAVQFSPICSTLPPQQYNFVLSVVPYHHLSSTVLFHLQYLTATSTVVCSTCSTSPLPHHGDVVSNIPLSVQCSVFSRVRRISKSD